LFAKYYGTIIICIKGFQPLADSLPEYIRGFCKGISNGGPFYTQIKAKMAIVEKKHQFIQL